MESLVEVERRLRDLARWLAFAGGALVLLDAAWITVSVFRRYVLNDPDPVVTEAAALLLLPLAFAGMAHAFAEDANPKVTMLLDALPRELARSIEILNGAIILAVGLLFAAFTGTATLRSYQSGAASPVIEWPEFYLWGAVCTVSTAFSFLALLRLICRIARPGADGRE